MGSSESFSMSSRPGGSRYPSAFGHTPTYRSYASIPDASVSDYPSALSRDLTRDLGSLSALQVPALLADGTLHLSWQAPISTCPLSEEDLLQPLQKKWNLIQAHTAAPAAMEAVQRQNIRRTPRTNLQLPERVVYLTHRMRTLHLDTLAKIHIKTKSPTILIISKLDNELNQFCLPYY